jgi:hypothetical protein
VIQREIPNATLAVVHESREAHPKLLLGDPPNAWEITRRHSGSAINFIVSST